MTQAFTAPVSGAAQAASTRTARTSPGGSSPPPGGSETRPFASVLDHHVARTAHAEGQHKTTGESGGRRSSHGHRAVTRKPTVLADSVQSATPAVEPALPLPVDATVAAQSTPVNAAAAAVQPPAPSAIGTGQATANGSPQTATFIPATVKPATAPVVAATPGDEAPATTADQLNTPEPQVAADPAPPPDSPGLQPSEPVPTEAAPTVRSAPADPSTTAPTTPTTPTAPTAPTASHPAKAGAPADTTQGDQQPAVAATTSTPAQPQAGNAGTPDPGRHQAAPAPAAQPAAPVTGIAATPAPQQVAPPTSAAVTATTTGPARYGVGLEQAIETVKTTIELGDRQGFSQARIQLAPASLGQITIHLQKTADGIVAKVVADHSAAAQTMQQGGDDLRRSLQNSGLHLLRLDIETRGDHGGSANGSAHTSQSGRTNDDQESAAAGDDGTTQPTTLVLPNGALVNVLA